ncbi:YcfL family protein [Shewanella surugensis]|uniref:YcfL family protein n=1 Tax=Shewanella surugensis TaxID=212020 RepID=A0ABT0L7I2_9GAMM|nr:YcfL family protein [Shewanella surugensis]MCL1123644.1 YcfL family protein [Shewanella surugensis]
MKKLFFILLVGLMLGGCSTNTAGILASSTGDLKIDSPAFAQKVKVDQLKMRGQGGSLEGVSTVISKISTDQHLQYKFTWYDGTGFTVDDETRGWQPLTLHGKESKQVSSVAPGINALWFEFYVREAHSN